MGKQSRRYQSRKNPLHLESFERRNLLSGIHPLLSPVLSAPPTPGLVAHDSGTAMGSFSNQQPNAQLSGKFNGTAITSGVDNFIWFNSHVDCPENLRPAPRSNLRTSTLPSTIPRTEPSIDWPSLTPRSPSHRP